MAVVPPQSEKVIKTGLVLTMANMVLAPAYFFNDKVGLALSIGVSALLLKIMHDMGEDRRPGANAVNRLWGLFAANTDNDLDNAFNNVINGGDVLFDDLTTSVFKK